MILVVTAYYAKMVILIKMEHAKDVLKVVKNVIHLKIVYPVINITISGIINVLNVLIIAQLVTPLDSAFR